MEIFIVFLLGLFVFFCYRSTKYRKSLLMLFCVLWFLIFLLYSAKLFDLYNCKNRTYLMYLIGFVGFFIGSILIRPARQQEGINYRYTSKLDNIKIFVLKALSIFSIFVLIRKSFLAIPYWIIGGAGAVKAAIVREGLGADKMDNIIHQFIAAPIQDVMLIYAIILIFEKGKDKSIILLAFLLLIAGYICSGSKFALVGIVTIGFSYIYLYSKNIRNVIIQHKILLTLSLAITILIVFLMSLKEEGSLQENFYYYLCGCVPFSDKVLDVLYDAPSCYGLATFNGVARVFNLVPGYLGITPEYKPVIDYYFDYMFQFEDTMYISKNVEYNAFISIFSYFFADAGYIGVAILSSLFGFSCAWCLKRSLKKPSICTRALALLMVVFISQSMVRIKTFYAIDVMDIIFILFLFPKSSLNHLSINRNKKKRPALI